MKKEDLFKHMSELDDDLIAEAGEEGVEVVPIHVAGGKKRFNIKPVAVTAACCVLLAGTAAVVGVNYDGGITANDVIDYPKTEGTEEKSDNDNTVIYPESAKYQYKGDYSEFENFGGVICIEFANYYDNYRDLLNACDVAVVGKFIDDPWQDIDPDDPVDFNRLDYGHSYNCFKVEKVLSSDSGIKEGDQLIISQSYAIAGNSFLSASKLTPMLKGDRWVYFLTFNESNGTYYSHNDYMGRFPDPGYCRVYDSDPDLRESANRFLPAMTNKYGLTEANDFNENIYRTLEEILCPSESRPSVQCMYDSENLEMYNETCFAMAEFEGLEFTSKDGVLYYKELCTYVSGDGTVLAGFNEVINKIYLADLNNDGKREICIQSCSNEDVLDRYILIWDYANQKVYAVIGETGKTEYYLGESDGELIAYNTKCTSDGSRGGVNFSEKLSLDMEDCFLHLDMSGHYERCQYDSDYCARQEGECQYRQNGHHDEENSTEHHGHSEYCLQDAAYCEQQGGECPYRQGEHHDDMNPNTDDRHSEYCLQDAAYCAQQEGECPYRQGEHHDEMNPTEHHGHSEYCLQDSSYCAQQGGECPYRQNGAANSAEHHGHSEYCLQDADYCAQQGGECPYRQNGAANSTEHHGHSEYCLQDADYCAQQGGDCPYRQDSHHGSGHHGDSHH